MGVATLLSFVLKQRSCHDENSPINMKLIWRKFFFVTWSFLNFIYLLIFNYQKAYQILRLKSVLDFVVYSLANILKLELPI